MSALETIRRTSRGRRVTEARGPGQRCTEAALAALGVSGWSPKYGTGVMLVLEDEGGYRVSDTIEGTLGEARQLCAHGIWYLFTVHGAGHAMALVDGVLTDTAGISDRRRVFALRLELDNAMQEAA